jgi:hypothetical protein
MVKGREKKRPAGVPAWLKAAPEPAKAPKRHRIRLSDLQSGSRGEIKGLICRKCGCCDLRVVYTRPARIGYIHRLRECRNCGYRFPTFER